MQARHLMFDIASGITMSTENRPCLSNSHYCKELVKVSKLSNLGFIRYFGNMLGTKSWIWASNQYQRYLYCNIHVVFINPCTGQVLDCWLVCGGSVIRSLSPPSQAAAPVVMSIIVPSSGTQTLQLKPLKSLPYVPGSVAFISIYKSVLRVVHL